MSDHSKLYKTAAALLKDKKGILAADQSVSTMNKQLKAIGVPGEAEMRRQYRQILFTTPNLEQYVSGVIMYDASIRNQTDDGHLFADLLIAKGIIPIIKVDKSTCEHTGFAGEVVTQGLDGLKERFAEYYELGARAAKWRAVFNIGDGIPTEQNILFDAIQLARYAALAHEAGIVPIVEPEVIYKGSHDIGHAEAVTTQVLRKVFEILEWYQVDLEAVILKSSMVLAGTDHEGGDSSPEEVAEATIRTFRNTVPERVPGIVFLSGGQTPEQATANFNAIAQKEQAEGLPWKLAFSFSRGLEQPVQSAWEGKPENIEAAQAALIKRLELNVAADQGAYDPEKE